MIREMFYKFSRYRRIRVAIEERIKCGEKSIEIWKQSDAESCMVAIRVTKLMNEKLKEILEKA